MKIQLCWHLYLQSQSIKALFLKKNTDTKEMLKNNQIKAWHKCWTAWMMKILLFTAEITSSKNPNAGIEGRIGKLLSAFPCCAHPTPQYWLSHLLHFASCTALVSTLRRCFQNKLSQLLALENLACRNTWEIHQRRCISLILREKCRPLHTVHIHQKRKGSLFKAITGGGEGKKFSSKAAMSAERKINFVF